MTRKRLKKLLMSYGIQRNEAENMCWGAFFCNVPYAYWWAKNKHWITCSYNIRVCRNVFENKIREFADSACEEVSKFADCLIAAIGKERR